MMCALGVILHMVHKQFFATEGTEITEKESLLVFLRGEFELQDPCESSGAESDNFNDGRIEQEPAELAEK